MAGREAGPRGRQAGQSPARAPCRGRRHLFLHELCFERLQVPVVLQHRLPATGGDSGERLGQQVGLRSLLLLLLRRRAGMRREQGWVGGGCCRRGGMRRAQGGVGGGCCRRPPPPPPTFSSWWKGMYVSDSLSRSSTICSVRKSVRASACWRVMPMPSMRLACAARGGGAWGSMQLPRAPPAAPRASPSPGCLWAAPSRSLSCPHWSQTAAPGVQRKSAARGRGASAP